MTDHHHYLNWTFFFKFCHLCKSVIAEFNKLRFLLKFFRENLKNKIVFNLLFPMLSRFFGKLMKF